MGIYEISVETSFTARHGLSLGGAAREPSHEHDWHVTATFRAAALTAPMAVVADFNAIRAALTAVTNPLEGSDLNALEAFADGTASAERVAEYLAGALQRALGKTARLYCLSVTEAPLCRAAFYPDGR